MTTCCVKKNVIIPPYIRWLRYAATWLRRGFNYQPSRSQSCTLATRRLAAPVACEIRLCTVGENTHRQCGSQDLELSVALHGCPEYVRVRVCAHVCVCMPVCSWPVSLYPKRCTIDGSQSHTLTLPAHQRQLTAMQGTNRLIRSNCGLGRLQHTQGGIEPVLRLPPEDCSYLLSWCRPMYPACMSTRVQHLHCSWTTKPSGSQSRTLSVRLQAAPSLIPWSSSSVSGAGRYFLRSETG